MIVFSGVTFKARPLKLRQKSLPARLNPICHKEYKLKITERRRKGTQ